MRSSCVGCFLPCCTVGGSEHAAKGESVQVDECCMAMGLSESAFHQQVNLCCSLMSAVWLCWSLRFRIPTSRSFCFVPVRKRTWCIDGVNGTTRATQGLSCTRPMFGVSLGCWTLRVQHSMVKPSFSRLLGISQTILPDLVRTRVECAILDACLL